MQTHTTFPTSYPVYINSPSGLCVQVNANGSIRRIDYHDIILNAFLGTELEGGPSNIYLRHHGTAIASTPLLGPRSPATFQIDAQSLTAQGEWQGMRFTVSLLLATAAAAWFWHVTLENTGNTTATLDLLYTQDVALAHYGTVRLNEYYVSQYVDHTPLMHPERGIVLAVRQNLSMGGRHPWAVIGSLEHGVNFATDALQFHGLATRANAIPIGLTQAQLPARRRQHEHAMAVLQDATVRLAPHVQEILPWFAHNAMIHYLAPRGLEQYSGGAWGTRDVTQGPVEMLLSVEQWGPLRQLLIQVYTAQNPDGDWPQWFMFFEREHHIRAGDSHGDIVFWPVLALAEYLLAAEDASLLDEVVPFFHAQGPAHADTATLWAHVERALQVMAARVIPGTHLAAYGHGDWNDSLQPADPTMRERLCSAWTVTLHYQTLTTLARALRRVGLAEPAAACEASAVHVRADFQRLLIVDDTLAGCLFSCRWSH